MKIVQSERKRILELFYHGNSRKEIADEVRHSSATVHRVIKTHERNVRENGLIYELSEEALIEPLELARLYGELQAASVSVTDCRDAVPIVQKCKQLKLEDATVNELIDAAVRLGEPNFPRQQFAQTLLRVLRRERETGHTIEQIDSDHNRLSVAILKLQSDERTLRTGMNQQQTRLSQLDTRIRNAQERLTGLERRLATVPVTEAQLETYIGDRNLLTSIGLNMNDISRIKIVLLQLAKPNYTAPTIISEIARIGDLKQTLQTLTKDISERQSTLTTTTHQKEIIETEIKKLENKRTEVRNKLQEEEADAHKRIIDSKDAVREQMAKAELTEQDLADFRAARDALSKGGVRL